MDILLRGYEVNQPTWFYLSTLLIIAVYFRFTRFFSLRNLDLVLLLSASPGLIFVTSSVPMHQTAGHAWLFVVACLFLLRLFLDPLLNRRPYLGQNLNPQGLAFLCVAAFAFLMTKAITESLPVATQETVARAQDIITRTATDPPQPGMNPPSAGPAAPLLATVGHLVFEDLAARILAILAHAAVIVGLWFIGRNLFADKTLGLAMATLYLLLPCTAYNVGEFNHVLPTALIVWAFVYHRRPVVSGILLGLACGTLLFPVFLLPIWAAYYGRKGSLRFVSALLGVACVLLASLALTSIDSNSFLRKTIGTINVVLSGFSNVAEQGGFWADVDYLSVYRLPVMVAYSVMLLVMTVWPKERSVEVLIAQSAAAIVGTQLWYTQKGGVYLLWYLPIMLMVIFRPRLLHLQQFGSPDTAAEGASSKSGRPPVPSPISRAASGANIQLFR